MDKTLSSQLFTSQTESWITYPSIVIKFKILTHLLMLINEYSKVINHPAKLNLNLKDFPTIYPILNSFNQSQLLHYEEANQNYSHQNYFQLALEETQSIVMRIEQYFEKDKSDQSNKASLLSTLSIIAMQHSRRVAFQWTQKNPEFNSIERPYTWTSHDIYIILQQNYFTLFAKHNTILRKNSAWETTYEYFPLLKSKIALYLEEVWLRNFTQFLNPELTYQRKFLENYPNFVVETIYSTLRNTNE